MTQACMCKEPAFFESVSKDFFRSGPTVHFELFPSTTKSIEAFVSLLAHEAELRERPIRLLLPSDAHYCWRNTHNTSGGANATCTATAGAEYTCECPAGHPQRRVHLTHATSELWPELRHVCGATSVPTVIPTSTPTAGPTEQPTVRPSMRPSEEPTAKPVFPTEQPSRQPTEQPVQQPTERPMELRVA